jgi:CheY-like chemotaxis protein
MAKILLVEDNEMNRDMLARRLRRKGYEVIAACDGREAIAVALAQRVDLLLMDLSLPVLDGWQATRCLKADPRTASLPVIALTAHAMPGDQQRAFDAGCDDYDTKPVDFNRLVAKIESQLKRCFTTETEYTKNSTTEVSEPPKCANEEQQIE